jgi:peptidylprolyl isomerase domain and WD repeat-containing protein 1
VTASIDGHVKLWKKQEQGIEFVKHYRAHLATIVGISASSDGQMFASVAEDRTAKVFDILNYGKSRVPHRGFSPLTACRYDQYDETQFYPPRMLLGA